MHSKNNTNIKGESSNHWAMDNHKLISFRSFNSVFFHLKSEATSVLLPFLKITVSGRSFKSGDSPLIATQSKNDNFFRLIYFMEKYTNTFPIGGELVEQGRG